MSIIGSVLLNEVSSSTAETIWNTRDMTQEYLDMIANKVSTALTNISPENDEKTNSELWNSMWSDFADDFEECGLMGCYTGKDELWNKFGDIFINLKSVNAYYNLIHWSPTVCIAQFTYIYQSNEGEQTVWTPMVTGRLNDDGKITTFLHVSDPKQNAKVVEFMQKVLITSKGGKTDL